MSTAYGLIVELKKGVEVEIDLAPHRKFSGELHMLTPPAAKMEAEYQAGRVDDFRCVLRGVQHSPCFG